MRVDFHASAEPTLGIEWEFALVDRESRDLVNAQAELFEEAAPHLKRPEQLHKEMLRNTVELVTGVCDTVGDAVDELTEELRVVVDAGDRLGPRPVRRRHPPVRRLVGAAAHRRATATRS